MNMPVLEKFDPLPAINHWFNLRDRHPRQNDKAQEQEWFTEVFDDAKNRSIRLSSHTQSTVVYLNVSFRQRFKTILILHLQFLMRTLYFDWIAPLLRIKVERLHQ